MICAPAKKIETIGDVDAVAARRARYLWTCTRTQLVEALPPRTAQWFRECWTKPDMLTVRRAAIDEVLDTHGVEFLGVHKRTKLHVYYCNAGDTYASTVIFHGLTLSVGCWGDWVEEGRVYGDSRG